MRADSTLPPLILLAGHRPSQEQKCLTLAKRLRSVLISLKIFITEPRTSPLMRVRSAPAQLASCWRTSNSARALLPVLGAFPSNRSQPRPNLRFVSAERQQGQPDRSQRHRETGKQGQSHALRGWWLGCFPGMMLALASLGLTLLALGRNDAGNDEGQVAPSR